MPRALLSVYDKTGIVDFAHGLQRAGWELIASGSTAKLLREHQISVTEVAEYTRSPEMLGGRVKTLHPAIHGGLLARGTEADRAELLAHNWDYINLVAVNLYPFSATIAKPNTTLEEAIEQIDIGGVALIRAAAKNHQRVTLVCDPADYAQVLTEIQQQGDTKLTARQQLAIKGFAITSQYDATILNYLNAAFTADKNKNSAERLQLTLYPLQALRYGENPHQTATLYGYTPNAGPLGGKLLQGKALSYNNLLDLDAAWKTAISFEKPTICIVKHLSPGGIASSGNLTAAYQAALACDPISAFGGVIAANKEFDVKTAEALDKLFVECIAAPSFSKEALVVLAKRTNCRLLQIPDLKLEPISEWRSINHGMLQQDIDQGDPDNTEWKVVTQRQPTEAEWQALRFAWRACQQVKSNAIVFAQNEATVGIGSGQPNRIDCVHIAAQRAGNKAKGAVMASDAFFPFPDCVNAAIEYGITAIIQPGGSVRDEESIAVANKGNIAMVITGVRHFRH